MPEPIYNVTKVNLGCDNCGHMDVYQIPQRRLIENYDREEDIKSHYVNPKDDETVPLICRHCKLACLQVFWYRTSDGELVKADHE